MKAQFSASSVFVTSATSAQALPARFGALKRTQFIIINTSAAVATITKGDNPAIANQGIVLQQNAYYLEGTDGGFVCWQGAIQAIATGAGTLSVVETFQEE